jgi:hypothetical protein
VAGGAIAIYLMPMEVCILAGIRSLALNVFLVKISAWTAKIRSVKANYSRNMELAS